MKSKLSARFALAAIGFVVLTSLSGCSTISSAWDSTKDTVSGWMK
jgi:uncharacterized protein YceK